MKRVDFAIAIGGEAGQGIATPGDILARIFARRGLNLNAYNAYQSIIRGGHTFLTIRASDGPVRSMGDRLDVLIPLNQDTMNRHLKLLNAGARRGALGGQVHEEHRRRHRRHDDRERASNALEREL